MKLEFLSAKTLFTGDAITVTAGYGGKKGENVSTAGGGNGGEGGASSLEARTLLLNNASIDFTTTSGDGGAPNAANQPGAKGGKASVEITEDLVVAQDDITFTFVKGADIGTGTGLAKAGTLDFVVTNTFSLGEGLTTHLMFDGGVLNHNGTTDLDQVHFDTIELKKGTALDAINKAKGMSLAEGYMGAGYDNLGDLIGGGWSESTILWTI